MTRRDNLLNLAGPDGGALPAEIYDALASQMSYTQRDFHYGPERRRRGTRVSSVRVRLYEEEPDGSLSFPAGYYRTVLETIRRYGYELAYEDLTNYPRGNPMEMEPQWDRLMRRVELRPGQREALEAIVNNPCGLIEAATGFGKSWLFGALAVLYPEARITVVARSLSVVNQLEHFLFEFTPHVGIVTGQKKIKRRVTVYSADSLHKYEPGESDILLADEAHQLAADSYAEKLGSLFTTTRNYGFTATIKRTDGKHARLYALFGPVIYRMAWQEAERLRLVVPIVVRWEPVRLPINPVEYEEDDVRLKRLGIWRNRRRNEIIAEVARRHPDDQVLILCETIEHAVALHQLLPDFTLCYGTIGIDDIRRIQQRFPRSQVSLRPLNKRQQAALARDFRTGRLRKVIATDVWSTGVSFERLAVLIRADARASPILDTQIPGRVCRLAPGKEMGVVYDFVDYFDARFLRRSRTRYRDYQRRGWEQWLPDGGRIA